MNVAAWQERAIMDTKPETRIESREAKAEDRRRMPRFSRLDELILNQMLWSHKPITAVDKSILEPSSCGADMTSVVEGQECFFFRSSWQAVC
jgi:hypothetical protein